MLTTNALTALRDFMRNSIASARWRSGSDWHDAPINGIDTLSSGSVRVRLSIAPEETVTVNRVELLDENGEEIDQSLLRLPDEEYRITIPVYQQIDVPLTFDYINVPDGIDVSQLSYEMSAESISIGVPVDAAAEGLRLTVSHPAALPAGETG